MKKRTRTTLSLMLCVMAHTAVLHAAAYYVATTGDDSTNPGTPASPWRTITKGAATAVAGDTVFIRGGEYGHEHVVVANSGSAAAPIVFLGYDGIPVLDGADWTGNGFFVYGKSYVTVKNLRAKNYRGGIWIDGESGYCTLDGCVADSCTNTDYVRRGFDGYGIVVQRSHHCVVKNCSTTDNGGDNIFLSKSQYCTIQNCRIFSTPTVSSEFITDYFLVASWSSNNVIRDCYLEDVNGSYKGNHGVFFKDTPGQGGSEPNSTGNLIVNCTAKKLEECFAFAHGAHDNIVDSCHADNTGKDSMFNHCFMVRDGARGNTFKNSTGVASIGAVGLYDGGEGSGDQCQRDNTFLNCTFQGGNTAVFMRNAVNTTFANCTFANCAALFRFEKTRSAAADSNRTVTMRNCIVSGVVSAYDTRPLTTNPWAANQYDDTGEVTAAYTDFWNGFPAFAGKGNISRDPLFADPAHGDFHLKSRAGRWNGTVWVTDSVTSPCIDAGDPADSSADEPLPNGGRINMGRQGNTPEASKSARAGFSRFFNWIPGR